MTKNDGLLPDYEKNFYDEGYDDGFSTIYQYVIDYLSSLIDTELADSERRLVEDLLDHFEKNLDTDLI
jgi:hypothetical protein